MSSWLPVLARPLLDLLLNRIPRCRRVRKLVCQLSLHLCRTSRSDPLRRSLSVRVLKLEELESLSRRSILAKGLRSGLGRLDLLTCSRARLELAVERSLKAGKFAGRLELSELDGVLLDDVLVQVGALLEGDGWGCWEGRRGRAVDGSADEREDVVRLDASNVVPSGLRGVF